MMRAWMRTGIAVVSVVAALAAGTTVRAQNYDGGGVLRFGAFGQGSFFNLDVTSTGTGSGDVSLDRIGFGAAFGYDHRFNTMILGVEADAATVNANGSIGQDTYATDFVSTFRARAGVYVRPDLLFYGTIGLALASVEYKAPGTNITGVTGKQSQTLAGFTGGLGLEYDWHGMALFGEYLYAGYESYEVGGVGGRLTIDPDSHLLRIGIKFKIGHDHYHDPYRDQRYK